MTHLGWTRHDHELRARVELDDRSWFDVSIHLVGRRWRVTIAGVDAGQFATLDQALAVIQERVDARLAEEALRRG